MIERRPSTAPNRRSSGTGDRGNHSGHRAAGANPVGRKPVGSANSASPSAHLGGVENQPRGIRDLHRDLSCPDVWQHSLERSRARRSREGRPPGASPARPRPSRVRRDLSDPELWRVSQARSRRRHEAHDPTFEPPARGLSIAALLLVTGGSATAIASTPLGRRQGRAPPTARTKRKVAAVDKPGRQARQRSPWPPGRAPAVVAPQRGGRPDARPSRPGGVADLQRKLGIAADGDFGPATKKALAAWQRATA